MATTQTLPKWATPDRKDALIRLFVDSGGFCVYGLKPCKGFFTLTQNIACVWGKDCSKPMADGQLCRYKPEAGKPHLPCRYVTFTRKRWHCGYGDYPCYKPFGSHYQNYADMLIADWKHLDIEQRQAEREAERKALHSTGGRTYPLRGQFSAISRDITAENKPFYYLEGQAVSGITLKPFVLVRLASSYMRLFVDLGEALKQVSKSQRRKAIRYGKPLPPSTTTAIRRKILEAVRDYYSH